MASEKLYRNTLIVVLKLYKHSLVSDSVWYNRPRSLVTLSDSRVVGFVLGKVHSVIPGVSFRGELRFLEFQFH